MWVNGILSSLVLFLVSSLKTTCCTKFTKFTIIKLFQYFIYNRFLFWNLQYILNSYLGCQVSFCVNETKEKCKETLKNRKRTMQMALSWVLCCAQDWNSRLTLPELRSRWEWGRFARFGYLSLRCCRRGLPIRFINFVFIQLLLCSISTSFDLLSTILFSK